jgi:hypothetical protein
MNAFRPVAKKEKCHLLLSWMHIEIKEVRLINIAEENRHKKAPPKM